MKKEWKQIEGSLVRIDVGSTYDNAMNSASIPAEAICFTSDGHIVLNGVKYSPNQDELDLKVDKEDGYALASTDQLSAAQWAFDNILTDSSSSAYPFLHIAADEDTGYTITHLVDGNTYNSSSVTIPIVSEERAGVVSAYDWSEYIKPDIIDGGLSDRIANLETAVANLKELIGYMDGSSSGSQDTTTFNDALLMKIKNLLTLVQVKN